MRTGKVLGFSSVVLDAPAVPQHHAWETLRHRFASKSKYLLKRAALALLGTAIVLFVGYQCVVLCMIYARVTSFTASNFATESDEFLGTKFILTRFEPIWNEKFGWVIQRDVTRYHKDAYYILPSNTKADTEFKAALAIYRQRWSF